METATLKLVVFSFILSILFPMFAYTFTSFGAAPETFDITLSVDELINSGIMLSEAESHNVTFGGAAQEYTVQNSTMRVKWVDSFLYGGYFAQQQQSLIEKLLGTWVFPIEMDVKLGDQPGWIRSRDFINSTVVNNFDPQYNWTKYTVIQNSLTCFITTLPADAGNMTKAIYDTGIVTVTVASQMFDSESINFDNFGQWYIKIVTGQGGDWGLPSFMVWIVRIFSFMTLLAAMLLARHFIPIIYS